MEETSTTPPSKLNLSKVLSKSNQIIKLQSRNFSFLAVVFLLPPTIAAFVYLMFQYPLLNDAVSNYIINIITNSFSPDQEHIPNRIPTSKTLLLPLIAYALFIFLSSLCAVGSITYTTFHGFHGQPIKLKSAIMSITTSFFPLLGTTLLIYTIVFAIILLFALVLFSAVNGTRSLGFDTEVFSPYFLVFSVAMAILFMFVLAYLHVNWALASAVVVVESTWGFESLKRSAILIKGRRGILLSVSYLLGHTQILCVWITCHSSLIMRLDGTATDELKPLFFNLAAQVLMTSINLALFQLLSMAAITVLYVHCKATHDGEEFPGEYVGVPVEDEEVGRVVYVNSESKAQTVAISAKLLNIRCVLSESRRLIKSQRRNFLFLLPPTIVVAVVQSLLPNVIFSTLILNPITTYGSDLDHQLPNTTTTWNNPLFLLACLLFNSTLYICSTGSITYAAFHGFNGESIRPNSTFNSMVTSFFPLLATSLLSHALVSLLGIVFALFFMAVIGGASLLGFKIEASSPFFTTLGASMVVIFVVVVIRLQVSWVLASVAVAAESTWRFEALKRSRTLIEEKKMALLPFVSNFGAFVCNTYPNSSEENNHMCLVMFLFVVQVLLTSSFQMFVKFHEMAANTALYVYCKAIRDGKESRGEYVGSLAVDDEKA